MRRFIPGQKARGRPAANLMTGTTDYSDAWVRRLHPSSAAVARLVCFPHAGGAASFFYPVSAAMPPSVEVLALQYPGRQDRRAEKLLSTIGEFSDHVVGALQPWTDLPLVFFGHSMGATIAFEVARALEGSGIRLGGLFVSGRRAPSRYRDEQVHLRPDDGIVAELMELNGTGTDLLGDKEILEMILPAVRSDYRAIETYRYQPGRDVSCPIIAAVGDSDPKATLDEVRDWQTHSTGSFELRVFPGGHFYLVDHQAELIRAISDHVQATLAAAAPAAAPGACSVT